MSKSKAANKSINLYPANGNGSDSDEEDGEDVDETELEKRMATEANKKGQLELWKNGGNKRNKLLANVINLSSKLVSTDLVESIQPNGECTYTKTFVSLSDAAFSASDLRR